MKKNLISILIVVSLVFGLFFLTACEEKTNTAPNVTLDGEMIKTGNSTVTIAAADLNKTTTVEKTDEAYKNVAYTLTGTEGDLITLKANAVDPDGDTVTYTYSSPFNKNGLWQTKDGDAGKYLITVTASDSKATTSADILVIVKASNKAPVIDCVSSLKVKEGDIINLNCNFFDKEDDKLDVKYSGWMTSKTFTTNYDSQGDHEVFLEVSDGIHTTKKTITVTVENVDRAPVFVVHLKDMTITESDVVTLAPEVTDPDKGDAITLTYSDPFSSKGIWKTALGDAGTYPISIVASDGTLSTKETFTLTVKMLNTAPVMKLIPDISVEEGDTVKIIADVTDREKDAITVTYSGWMKSASYTTTYDDANPKGCDEAGCSAKYKVTVKASDGVFEATQDVYVTVKDKNRPPVFVWQ